MSDTERHVLEVVEQKARLKQEMGVSMGQAMKEFQTDAIRGRNFTLNLSPQMAIMPEWLKEAI